MTFHSGCYLSVIPNLRLAVIDVAVPLRAPLQREGVPNYVRSSIAISSIKDLELRDVNKQLVQF